MRAADQWTVRAHHQATGSPEQATAHQDRSRSARKNSYSEVSAVGIFEKGSIMIDSKHTQLFPNRRVIQNGWLLVSSINFFVDKRQPPALSLPNNEHWICFPKSALSISANCPSTPLGTGFPEQAPIYQDRSRSVRIYSYLKVSVVGIF